MGSGYSKEQLLKAQSQFQLASDMLEMALDASDDETNKLVIEAIEAGDEAFEEIGLKRRGGKMSSEK